MNASNTRLVLANGVRLHLTEQGSGPLVLLCHGFPETSHVWRNQIPVLAAAGFRAVAPDLRGYGQSERPESEEAYSVLDIVSDLVALVSELGEREAVIVGGDWGASIAWQAARIRPDVFRAVAALGVPMMGRAPMSPSSLFPQTPVAWFYTHYFAQHDLPERELEIDIAMSLRKIYFAASGDAGPRDDASTPNPFGMLMRSGGLLTSLPEPTTNLDWLAPRDFEILVGAFEASGFRGGLNYYRNLDRNWAVEGAFEGLGVSVPAMYLIGERDTGLAMPGMREIIQAMPNLVKQLRVSEVIPHAGHWLQQEAPEAVNRALLDFLRSL